MEHRNTDNHIILDKPHLEIMSDLLNLNVTNSIYNKIIDNLDDSVTNYNEAILISTICELIPKENIFLTKNFHVLIAGDLSDESFYFHVNDDRLFLITFTLDNEHLKCVDFVFDDKFIYLFKDIQYKTYEEDIFVDDINHFRDLYDFLPDYFKKYYEVTKREEPLE